MGDNEPKSCEQCYYFYGSPDTMNLCSMCYKDFCLKEEQARVAKDENITKIPDAAVVMEAPSEPLMPKVNPNRCMVCNKKVRMMGFTCKCGSGLFCGEHRYPECHDCTYDYKGKGKEALAKANPVVKGDKLDRL
ncbi:hypothetical protein SAY86_010390 [Trapa natans]|uniref:AN1-type domain-containing protein n=1 Tax=Trapa natans TaxID=22666 RepID=A0AAN7R1S5_TRANT|nr:hypothetical protein SAY86_010390 [Trapa natans]